MESKFDNRSEHELIEIWLLANEGNATEAQVQLLNERLETDSEARQLILSISHHQGWLTWQAAPILSMEPSGESPELANDNCLLCAERKAKTWRQRAAAWQQSAFDMRLLSVRGLAVVACLLAVSLGLRSFPWHDSAPAMYEARLVRSTACLWDGNSTGSLEIGSGLTSGESVHLLEGLAEFKLNWAASGQSTISLEGPAAMMLTSEGMPTLRFGRLTATVSTTHRPFVLETAVGRLVVAEYGSIGVSAFGNEGEIHVFNGTAILEPAWRSPDEESMPLKIEAGHAIRVRPGDDGQPSITYHPADADYFAAQVSMASDGLAVPSAYVKAIKKARPVGYWRFERDQWPLVPNAIGGNSTCRATGGVGRTTFHDNQSVEFGLGDQFSQVLSTGPIDGSIHGSYSVEFWMKPSHCHAGAVVSLIGDKPNDNGVLPHGMLIELGGYGKIPTTGRHPGCIRYLHRSPAGNEAETGTSCFSNTPYRLRKWQQVVATKDGPQMRLYINGVQVAEGEDPSDLSPGLRLLVGRLYPDRGGRPFIGQLDELALYNRALRPEEITQHYKLVRPTVVSERGI